MGTPIYMTVSEAERENEVYVTFWAKGFGD